MSPEKKVSALWICPLLQMHRFPFKPLAKVGAFTRPIAQFTLVFWIYFSFMRKPHPRLTNKDTEEMLLVGPQPVQGSPFPPGRRKPDLGKGSARSLPPALPGAPRSPSLQPVQPLHAQGVRDPASHQIFFFFFLLTFRTAFLPSNTNSRL